MGMRLVGHLVAKDGERTPVYDGEQVMPPPYLPVEQHMLINGRLYSVWRNKATHEAALLAVYDATRFFEPVVEEGLGKTVGQEEGTQAAAYSFRLADAVGQEPEAKVDKDGADVITRKMVESGMRELAGYAPGIGRPDETVARIYEAMRAARPQEPVDLGAVAKRLRDDLISCGLLFGEEVLLSLARTLIDAGWRKP